MSRRLSELLVIVGIAVIAALLTGALGLVFECCRE